MVRMPPAPSGPEQVSLYSDLPDHAAQRDDRSIPIDEVGIRRLRYPVSVKDKAGELQATVAEVEMTVGLPGDVKGTHMSRFIEVLNAHRGEMTISNLPEILNEMQRRLEADDVAMRLEFPYFIDKEAPVSRVRSLMEYRCGFRARKCGPKVDFTLVVGVPVKSLCPCSKAISDYGAHNQRSEVIVELQSSTFVWIEDVVAAVEGCASSPVYALLKREDEKWVTERAYENPRFVEDLVREVLMATRALPGVHSVRVSAENFESIHNHSAYATLQWEERHAEPEQLGLGLPATTVEELPFGQWVRQNRESRGLSQGELSERAGCSTSFLSKVESGTKTPSAESLVALAAALGQDPLKTQVRAGVIPPEILARIQASPEAFLRWAAHF